MIKNRQIIGIVVIIFVAFVGYKFVSSGIQESKEKAVLQEKYQLEQATIKNEEIQQQSRDKEIASKLESCLIAAEAVKNKDINFLGVGAKCWGVGTLTGGSYDECTKNNGAGREICELQQGRCIDYMTIEFGKVNTKFEKDKQECYSQYK